MFLLPLFRQNMETDTSDTSDADDTERLGEKIFSLVDELDPLHANDITGDLILWSGIPCKHHWSCTSNIFGGLSS